MKGYQRADRPREAGSLADVPRDASSGSSQRAMHGATSEGNSWCLQGRRSYQLTDDPTRVTCKSCLRLMEEKK